MDIEKIWKKKKLKEVGQMENLRKNESKSE